MSGIVYREGLGRPLTWQELDGNFQAVERISQTTADEIRRDVADDVSAAQAAATSASVSASQAAASAGTVGPTVDELTRRSYADAGYNVVGTFQDGFTYVNANDVGIDKTTGKGYTGPAGQVPAGTNPATGGFVDRSGNLLRQYKAPFVGASSRDIPDRLADQVSIRDFHVYGSGVEETTNIQKAVSEVLGSGRTLLVPPPMVGSHYICQDIQFPNTSWKMKGDGGPTVVQFATPTGVSNQNIFDLTNCNGPAKWLEGVGFGRLTPGSYDGIIGLLTNNTNGLHMLRCWFRGLARSSDLHGTFFELDGNVIEYCATGFNGLTNLKESLIRGTTYYRNEQDIIIPAGDNSTFMHVDSTHIGTKTRGVDIRGDNAYVAGVTAKDDNTGFTPVIVRITSGKSNQVHGVTSSFGADVIKVEGAASVGNQLFGLMVPAGSTVQRALNVSSASRTCLFGADVKQSSVSAFRLDTAPNSELHGAFSDGAATGLSINALSGFRMYGGGFSGSTVTDTAQDSNNSTAPRFYGTRGDITPITSAVYV